MKLVVMNQLNGNACFAPSERVCMPSCTGWMRLCLTFNDNKNEKANVLHCSRGICADICGL